MPRGKSKDYSDQFGGLDIAKDRYDENREGFVDEQGNYHYVTGIGMGAAVPPVVPLHGKNGEDNSEWIKILAEEDHKVNIQKRNDKDHADGLYISYKRRQDTDDRGLNAGCSPIDKETYLLWEAKQNGEEDDDEDPVLVFVHEFLCSLNDADQTIMFGVFGSERKQNDVADELHRDPKSISRSIQRIERRLTKALADKLGYHGEDRHKE